MTRLAIGTKTLPISLPLSGNYALINRIADEIAPTIALPRDGLFASRTKATLFQDNAAEHTKLTQTWDQICDFVRGTVKCSMIDKTGNGISEPNTDRLLKTSPLNDYHSLAELSVKPALDVHAHLNAGLQQKSSAIVKKTFNVLKTLRDYQFVGGIRFIEGRACQGFFYKWVLEDEAVATRNGARGKETQVRRTMKHRIEVHEVIDTVCHPWNSRIAKPPEVEGLLRTVPPCLRPHVKIITGTEIHKAVFERIVATEDRTEVEPYPVTMQPAYRFDPFVVLGDFALTGW